MTWLSLGTLALPYQLQRHGVALRNDVARLAVEVTTGVSSAPQRTLRGDMGPLAALEMRASRVDRYAESARAALTVASMAQNSLAQLAQLGSDTGARMLAASATGTSETILSAGQTATGAFKDAVSALGARLAGRALFSGVATDHAPLASGDEILQQLAPVLAGLTSADAVADAIAAEFTNPGGLFETSFYQGGGAAVGTLVDEGQRSAPLPTAADPALRKMLAGLATAAFVADPGLALGTNQRAELGQRAAVDLMGAAPGVTALQANLGESEARLDARVTGLTGERDALSLARQMMIGVDPYEAATRLEQAQTQLQTLYAVTARTARLSLTEYL